MDHDNQNQQGDTEKSPNQLQEGTNEKNLSNPDGETNSEIAIAIRSEEPKTVCDKDGEPKPKINVLDTSKESEEEQKVKALKPEMNMFIIDIKNENFNREKVCRICHLSSEHSSGTSDLIQLGCGCKDELGTSHRYCAEAWFKHKGNRKCEICGGTAKNIAEIEVNGFRAGWNETRLMGSGAVEPSDEEGSCRWRKHLCNILLASLVMAFVLPWFFHVDTV